MRAVYRVLRSHTHILSGQLDCLNLGALKGITALGRPVLACLVFGLGLLNGCQHGPSLAATPAVPATLAHLYDYQLIRSATRQPIMLDQLVTALARADVIFIGELHGHSASHYLQMQLLSALYHRNPKLILSMEQFSRDKQAVLQHYLADEIGEQTLIAQGNAWPNYSSDYRPLVEFAKAHRLPVVAANAPKALVRCIARKGPAVAAQFPVEQRAYLAANLTDSSMAYQEKYRQFLAAMGDLHSDAKTQPGTPPTGHSQPDKRVKAPAPRGALSNSFYAQLARDNTMAESIAQALDAQPGSQVIAINGAFHSDGKLGTVDALKRLKPNLTIKVISPYPLGSESPDLATAAEQGDYLYTLQALPQRYVQKNHRDRAMMEMMKRKHAQSCKW